MRTPLQLARERIIALVRREVAESVAAENLEDLKTFVRETVFPSLEDLRTFVHQSISPTLEEIQALMPHVIDRIDDIDERLQAQKVLLESLVERLDQVSYGLDVLNSRVRAEPFKSSSIEIASAYDASSTIGYDKSTKGNYVDFVDVFRPKFDDLYSELLFFKRWFPSDGLAVDLGAGRGEMVKVMSDHGLESFGIDSDASVVQAAHERGIDVRQSDINHFFKVAESQSLDLVSAIQVVEHVDTNELESWFQDVKRVLKPGGVFVVETPNPHAIDAFKAFWVDVTHVRPYYPESLLHMAQAAGFTRAEIWAPGEQLEISTRLGFAGSYVLVATA